MLPYCTFFITLASKKINAVDTNYNMYIKFFLSAWSKYNTKRLYGSSITYR